MPYEDPDEWINPGDSVVVAPGGRIVAGPLHEAFGLLYAEIALERVGMARRNLDVAGHYRGRTCSSCRLTAARSIR